MKKKRPIMPVLIEQWDAIEKHELGPINVQLVDRMSYILRTVGKACGFTFNSWNIDTARHGYYGDIRPIIYTDFIDADRIVLNGLQRNPELPTGMRVEYEIIINGKSYDIMGRLPTRWLFEDFEQELKAGVNKQRELRHKAEMKIKSSLSAKERMALGVYLSSA